jgi:hypothetical protein
MSKAKGSGSSRGFDQQVQLPSSGIEFRKGGNVLPTSDPKAPAPNPFVRAQKEGPTQNKSTTHSGDGQSNKSN